MELSQTLNKGDTFVRCSTCKTDFSCAHSEKFDCKCHFETKGHKDFDKLRTNKKSITEFCVKSVKTVLKRDGGTRRMQSSCYAPLFHKWILTLRHYPQIQTSNQIQQEDVWYMYILQETISNFSRFSWRGDALKPP